MEDVLTPISVRPATPVSVRRAYGKPLLTQAGMMATSLVMAVVGAPLQLFSIPFTQYILAVARLQEIRRTVAMITATQLHPRGLGLFQVVVQESAADTTGERTGFSALPESALLSPLAVTLIRTALRA